MSIATLSVAFLIILHGFRQVRAFRFRLILIKHLPNSTPIRWIIDVYIPAPLNAIQMWKAVFSLQDAFQK